MPKKAFRRRQGFTLVEILVVLAVISILSTLSMMALASLTAASHLNEATSVVQGQLELARQTAKTLNRSVQLRLYQEASTTSAAAAAVIDRMQIVVPAEKSTTETDQAIEKPVALPQGVIIADGSSDLKLTEFSGTQGPSSDPFNPPLPANYTGCYVLTFSPTGAVTTTDSNGNALSPSSTSDSVYWQLSPVPETPYRAKGSVSALQNYATFYLNSINGTFSCTRPE